IIPKLMFGTTPLSYKGSSTKIHLLNEPAQIMLTKTFSIHPTDIMAYTNASTRRGSFSNSPISSSLPNSSHIRPRTPRPGFDVRRLRRASQTSMENGTFNPMPLPSSFSHLDSLGNAKAARPKSFSIAVFIEVNNNTRLREFVFSHFALLETRMHQLQALCLELLLPICRKIINAVRHTMLPAFQLNLGRLIFQQDPRLQEAVARLQQAIYQLYSAPRIQSPLWLNINTYPSKRAAYSLSFMNELTILMEESPASAQLVSEVISAVLKHHTSWVPTIAPADRSLIRANPQGAYDPLWAQLSDLYGNIGTSSRISRTIVVGLNGCFVRRLLFILSYFIRCNEVFQRTTEFKEDPDSLLNPPPPSRTAYDLLEDHESGSPATLMRSISIPKRPRIDTFAARGSLSHTVRSRTFSSDTVGSETPRSAHDSGCPTQDVLIDVPLPVSRVVCSFPPFPSAGTEDKILPADVLFCKSYGRSLMAPYCDRYMSDFALMGVPKFDFQHFMETDMRDTMRHFEIQERVASTVCIVADTNTMKCNVFCAKPPPPLPAGLDASDLRGGLGMGLGGGVDLRGEPVTRMPHTSSSVYIDETLHQMVKMAQGGITAEHVSLPAK
ncbi:folliculin-interacting protein middle domain-containing protein, partial [Dissophora ornata]